ncbi:CD98hc amino acid transporter protein [Culex quinquefasciatus]|uniref:alpha-glucosidase n=1 Tax=Culex quinquefasciatus TaxID=7176 RepID=B0WXV7_CULQU|nr:CD98hc amino acid transporter protein [Culex quinquefasciatus]|eukprot:XP_001862229.1 CD98hc amino acid transporter protein [Culex quinquefasciatus]
MDETNRNSAKLDIEAARQQSADKENAKEKLSPEPKESYKKLSDAELDQANGAARKEPADSDDPAMVRENGNCKDGEDEKMLNGGGAGDAVATTNGGGGEKEKLTQKELEVTFTSEGQNGDVRINLEVEKQQTFSGMSKEELMKFANDPFWVRLRWFLFVVFWGLWIGMLAGAVYIILDAPKCAAPVPLSWWQTGPLVTVDEQSYREQVADVKKFGASGVIYKLPEDETYFVEGALEGKIKELVKAFGDHDIKVILDVTANYVTRNDPLFKEATASADAPQRSAFVWRQSSEKTNWLEVGTTDRSSAWKPLDSQLILGQFGADRFDLQLSEPIAKDKLKSTLRRLAELGVSGFRLANAKHFIVDRAGKDDEVASPAADKSLTHDHYDFWTHAHTTYQAGLGALLHELALEVRNYTKGDGFLSVSEDIVRPEAFAVDGSQLGVDLPEYGNVETILKAPITAESAKIIRDDIERTLNETNLYSAVNGGKPWNQWPYDKASLANVPASEYNVFMFLLPGVPVVPLDVLNYGDGSHAIVESLNKFRKSPSFEHGSFAIYTDANATSIGYTRQKSGNPGYFVALNPTDAPVKADFGLMQGIAEELTVVLVSANYREEDIAAKSKIQANAVPLSARSALIATYVPK